MVSHDEGLMNLLDNPIWGALTTRHAYLAIGSERAKRYPREITSLVGLAGSTPAALDDLATLVHERETVALFLDSAPAISSRWELVSQFGLLQMLHSGTERELKNNSGLEMSALGAEDSEAMVALAKLTNPGPVGPRTYEIGDFIGVKYKGRLVAMAGERLRIPGYSEVSGVCTHPEFEGKGLAAALVVHVTNRICQRGERAFLHLRADNDRALKLYERLGFSVRAQFRFGVLRRLL